MGKVHTLTQMVLNTLDNGKMINNTGLVLSLGLMVLFMKDNTVTVKSTEQENWLLQMDQFIKVNSIWMKFKDKAFIYGQIIRNMKAIG